MVILFIFYMFTLAVILLALVAGAELWTNYSKHYPEDRVTRGIRRVQQSKQRDLDRHKSLD